MTTRKRGSHSMNSAPPRGTGWPPSSVVAVLLGCMLTACQPTAAIGDGVGGDGAEGQGALAATAATKACGEVRDCRDECTSRSCLTKCMSAGTGSAQSKVKALEACIAVACPSRLAECMAAAQRSGGKCGTARTTCDGDGATNPGSPTEPTVGATCKEIDSCEFDCLANDVTCREVCVATGKPSSQVKYETLKRCVDTLCPGRPVTAGAAPSGVCDYDPETGAFLDKHNCRVCRWFETREGDCVDAETACKADAP